MDKHIKIKELVLDIEKAVKRIKLDIKDDWFQDPLKYEDILNAEYIIEKIKNRLVRKGDWSAIGYRPGNAIMLIFLNLILQVDMLQKQIS